MIAVFFKPRPKKGGTAEQSPIPLDQENDDLSGSTPTPPPKAKRCGKYDALEKRLKSLNKYNTEGHWRKHHLQENLSWTVVIQTWTHSPSGKVVEVHHFCPYGMSRYVQGRKSLDTCKANYRSLPKEIKDEFKEIDSEKMISSSPAVIME